MFHTMGLKGHRHQGKRNGQYRNQNHLSCHKYGLHNGDFGFEYLSLQREFSRGLYNIKHAILS